jgi:hypothetical protein
LQTWESNPAPGLMRPKRAPARLQWRSSGDGGIRTHTVHVLSVATPAGWSTSPCRQCAGQESNLRSGARRFYRPRGLPGPTDACAQWHGWESNPQTPRFELGRYAGSRTVPRLTQAPQTGFEPVTSTLTEWRANQAAPQGRTSLPHPRSAEPPVGVEPTLPPYQDGRLPLQHGGVVRAPSGSRTHTSAMARRQAAATSWARQYPVRESSPPGRLERPPTSPEVEQGVSIQWKRWESNPRRPV